MNLLCREYQYDIIHVMLSLNYHIKITFLVNSQWRARLYFVRDTYHAGILLYHNLTWQTLNSLMHKSQILPVLNLSASGIDVEET